MATRINQIVRFTAVAPAATVALPHEINVTGLALIPDRAFSNNADFTINSVTTTTVTVTNNGGIAANCDVWLEWLHTYLRVFGASATITLIPDPFIIASGGGTSSGGNADAFTYTCTGAEGSDFNVTLPSIRATDNYVVNGSQASPAANNIIGFNFPDTLAGDRTTTLFRVVTTAAVVAGDKIDFVVRDRT
jgi:hypothetical protein